MSAGSILVGGALLILVAAYLGKPFRKVAVESLPDWVIEAWIEQARRGLDVAAPGRAVSVEQDGMEYCSRCGRRAEPDDLFCAQCGAKLREVQDAD